MTYENIYELLKYLKERNIGFSPQLKRALEDLDEIKSEFYKVFTWGGEIIKLYTKGPTLIEDFIKALIDQKEADETIEKYLQLIAAQDTWEKQREVREACKVAEIRKDKEALILIASQKTWMQQEQMRLACMVPEIREDKEVLILIASQKTRNQQEQMRLACMVPEIREDKEALKLIAAQDTWEKQREVRKACEVPEIIKDKDALRLIASQETWMQQEQMRLACMVPEIREDKEVLKLIAAQDTWEKQEQVRLACMVPEIREDKEVLRLIAAQDTWEKQREVQEEFIRYGKERAINLLKSWQMEELNQKPPVVEEYEERIKRNISHLLEEENYDIFLEQYPKITEKAKFIRTRKHSKS